MEIMNKILFTGSSSFTGFHFIKEIANNNIPCHAIFSKSKKNYNRKNITILEKQKSTYLHFKCNYNSTAKITNIIKKNKINILCMHHFNVGNLNKRYIHSITNNQMYKTAEAAIALLSKVKNRPLVIYTASYYQKISRNTEYRNDDNRLKYGFAKHITQLIYSYLCKKYNVQMICYLLKNPIGPYEKKNSLPDLLSKKFFKKINFSLINAERKYLWAPIGKIAKDYVKCILKKRNIKSKYSALSLKNFEKKFTKNFLLCKQGKCKNLFWSEYYNYYKNKLV